MTARLGLFIATCGYIGFAPVAPGTVGSAAGVVLFYLVRATGVPWAQGALIVALFAAGVWAASVAERSLGAPILARSSSTRSSAC